MGPGDPELLTLKAIRIIRECDTLVFPAKDAESCRAYRIVSLGCPEVSGKRMMFRPFPMTKEQEVLDRFHDALSRELCAELSEGKTVGFLTIGDPSVYSTYSYIRSRVQDMGFDCETIPGVPSFTAAAARLGISLADGSEMIHIIPGSGDTGQSLSYPGTRIYMKSGMRLGELKKALLSKETLLRETLSRESLSEETEACGNKARGDETQGKEERIFAVSDCGMDSETLIYGAEALNDKAGYLTVVIVKS